MRRCRIEEMHFIFKQTYGLPLLSFIQKKDFTFNLKLFRKFCRDNLGYSPQKDLIKFISRTFGEREGKFLQYLISINLMTGRRLDEYDINNNQQSTK